MVHTTLNNNILEIHLDIDETNSLNNEAMLKVKSAFDSYKDNEDVKVVILKSRREKYFSNGLDPRMFVARTEDEIRNFCRLIIDSGNSIAFFPVPAIAVIEGHCMGAGAVFAISCDYRYMVTKGARIGFPEILIAMNFPISGTLLLQSLVGTSNARELLYTGKALKGNKAKEIGLVDEVDESPAIYKKAVKMAQKLAKTPRKTLVQLKLGIIERAKENAQKYYESDIERLTQQVLDKNCQEGFRSILENRRPIFR
jgi:enoyl-CoA hydratase/carnithine racemase